MVENTIRFTKADYDRLPEDLRVELIDGALLKMASPTVRHQEIVKHAFVELIAVVGVERLLFGPVDFVIDDSNVLVPDLVVFAEGAVPARDARALDGALAVLEVLSPSTTARDRTVKSDLYLRAGVAEVWLLDPRGATIEVRTRAGERSAHGDERMASEAVAGFAVSPSGLMGS